MRGCFLSGTGCVSDYAAGVSISDLTQPRQGGLLHRDTPRALAQILEQGIHDQETLRGPLHLAHLGHQCGDARVIVMHHNPVKGELSQRHGLKNTRKILGAFAQIGTDLVLCGHDHQEAIHYVEHTRRGTVISTAGTVSNRSRGGRPSSVNVITITPDELRIVTHIWSSADQCFAPGPSKCFARSSHESA